MVVPDLPPQVTANDLKLHETATQLKEAKETVIVADALAQVDSQTEKKKKDYMTELQ